MGFAEVGDCVGVLRKRMGGRVLTRCRYMGLGTYFGYFVSQNGRGHVLGHVKDLGEDPTKTDKVVSTQAEQERHRWQESG